MEERIVTISGLQGISLDSISGSYEPEDPYVGSLWSKVKDAVSKTNQAITTAYHSAVQHGTAVAQQALAKGKAFEHAIVKANKATIQHLQATIKHTLNQITSHLPGLKPYERVLAYLLLPPPVGPIAAMKYVKAHRTAVLNSLPPAVRDFVKRLEKDLDGIMGGKITPAGSVSGVSDYPRHIQTIAGWKEIHDKIARSWDQLPKSKKTEIIAILVIVVIIICVVIYFSAGSATPVATQGGVQAGGAGTQAAAPGFFTQIGGYKTLGSLIPALLAMFKKHPGAPAFTPPADVAPPDATQQQQLADTYQAVPSDPSEPNAIPTGKAGAYAAGAAVGLGVLGHALS